MFQSNIFGSVCIDEYILIPGQYLKNKNLKFNPSHTNYYYRRRHICNNFPHFLVQKDSLNKMKLIKKAKYSSFDSCNILIFIDLAVDFN